MNDYPSQEELKNKLKDIFESADKDKKPKIGCLGAIGILIGGFIASILNTLMMSFTVWQLWDWFITPEVNYRPSFKFILGSLIIFVIYKMQFNMKDKDYKSKPEDILIVFFATLFTCLVTLGMGFFWYVFV